MLKRCVSGTNIMAEGGELKKIHFSSFKIFKRIDFLVFDFNAAQLNSNNHSAITLPPVTADTFAIRNSKSCLNKNSCLFKDNYRHPNKV